MTPAQAGFLLLTSHLGDPERPVLSPPQLRKLTRVMAAAEMSYEDRELECGDLVALGYSKAFARRVVSLLEEEERLEHYLYRGSQALCAPISRIDKYYPLALRKRLGEDAPGCLWAKGDLDILDSPMIALVGSRDLQPENRRFAAEVGRQAAIQGYTLISGNARGSDRTAQDACLEAGGRVVSIVADSLAALTPHERVLYLSEDGFDETFSAQRALSRNRCIHALGRKTLVAQCGYQTGGSWDGSVKNLRFGWSPLFCFRDGTPAMELLAQMGATPVTKEMLSDLESIQTGEISLFAD